MHRQLAHLYIVNTHYNDIHYYYNDIHYFNNPNISLIRPPSGPKLFGLVRVYCTTINNTKRNMTKICRLIISSPMLVTSTAGSNFWHVWSQICIVTQFKIITKKMKETKKGFRINRDPYYIK